MKRNYYLMPNGRIEDSSPEFPPRDGVKLPQVEGKARLKEQVRQELREILTPGTKVFAILRQVSASGMSRRITFLTIQDNQPYYLDWKISVAIDACRPDKGEGLKIGGCGMDMAYHVVNSLSYALHGMGRDTDTPEQVAARGDARPGYTLESQWI